MKEANANDLVDQVGPCNGKFQEPRLTLFTFADDWGAARRPENSLGGA